MGNRKRGNEETRDREASTYNYTCWTGFIQFSVPVLQPGLCSLCWTSFQFGRLLANSEGRLTDAAVSIDLTVSSDSEECDRRDEESESDCSGSEWMEAQGAWARDWRPLDLGHVAVPAYGHNHLLKSEEDDRPARETPEIIHLDDNTDYSVPGDTRERQNLPREDRSATETDSGSPTGYSDSNNSARYLRLVFVLL